MKFTVHRDVLREAVAWVSKAVPNRPTVPILSGIKLSVVDGGVRLSAFDFEQSAEAHIETIVTGDETVVVSGRMFADIVKALPAKDVTFDATGPKVKVSGGASKFTMTAMNVADYPATPGVPSDGLKIDAEAFAQAIGQVTVAASRDETLPILRAVQVEVHPEDGLIRFSATDRYRLAVKEVEVAPTIGLPNTTHIVSSRFLDSYVKSSPVRGEIKFSVNSGQVAVIAGGFTATTTVIDGEYPKVERLFPKETEQVVTIHAGAFIEAAKRVSLVAERNTPIRLSFDEDQVTLRAGTDDESSASETIDANYPAAPEDVAFNPSFLTDALNAAGSPWVTLEFVAASKPVVMRPMFGESGGSDSTYRHLLMPVRV